MSLALGNVIYHAHIIFFIIENFPLHKDTLKLLVKPMREIISRGNQTVIKSGIMKCPIPHSMFYLKILSGDRKKQYVSADLYLLPGDYIAIG